MKYTGNPIRQSIQISYGESYFHLTPFMPTPSLTQSINNALKQGWPLLLTGDRYRCLMMGKILGYDLYGESFLDVYRRAQIMGKEDQFQDLVYFYDYELRQRDLEYYSITQNKDFLRPVDYYLELGPITEIIKLQNESTLRPILEITDLHNANEYFVKDLMGFFLLTRSIYIHETQEEIRRTGFSFPIILLTADKGFKLPKNYDGIIFTHELELTKEHLFEETLLRFSDFKIDGGKKLIEKIVELFFLLRNSTLVKTTDSDYPGSLLELYNTIELKIDAIISGNQDPEEVIEEIDAIIESQIVISKHQNINEAIDEIIDLIARAELEKAISNLSMIKDRLPNEFHIRVNTFLFPRLLINDFRIIF